MNLKERVEMLLKTPQALRLEANESGARFMRVGTKAERVSCVIFGKVNGQIFGWNMKDYVNGNRIQLDWIPGEPVILFRYEDYDSDESCFIAVPSECDGELHIVIYIVTKEWDRIWLYDSRQSGQSAFELAKQYTPSDKDRWIVKIFDRHYRLMDAVERRRKLEENL